MISDPKLNPPAYYLAGIDEAGYGPSLGPLVITKVLFKTPRRTTNLWQALNKIISRQKNHPKKITVLDSKKVYNRSVGLRELEKTVLVFAQLFFNQPLKHPGLFTIRDFINKVCPNFSKKQAITLDAYKKNFLLSIPLAAEAEEIKTLSIQLKDELKKNNIELRGIRANIIDPAEFNRGINKDNNKSDLLFNQTGVLLSGLYKKYILTNKPTDIYAGKQGGRIYYKKDLGSLFKNNRIRIKKEVSSLSSYAIINPTPVNDSRQTACSSYINFVRDGEDHHFTIALASMFSKYLRELCMKAFNLFWQEQIPSLKPTAGYPLDARRFLKEILPLSKKLNLPRDHFIRIR